MSKDLRCPDCESSQTYTRINNTIRCAKCGKVFNKDSGGEKK